MKMFNKQISLFLSFLLSCFGVIILYKLMLSGNSPFWTFVLFYFLIVLINPPRYAISLLTVYYAYYGLWFVIAPMFGNRLVQALINPYYFKSILYVFITFCAGMLAITLADSLVRCKVTTGLHVNERVPSRQLIVVLYILSSISVVAIIFSSGGISRWIDNPGDAFLNRAGSGVYVILSHFFTMLLAGVSGFRSWKNKKPMPVILFLVWLVVTSPVHGSKLQIAMFLIIAFLPWLRNLKLANWKAAFLGVVLTIVFIMGLLFRGFDLRKPQQLISGIFYYFNTLDLLAIIVRDFNPSFMMTFFTPFNKFLTPFGLSSQTLYYDMNHFLTSIYFPEAWQIRATQQWPVETDLYLNFFFFGGIWIFFLYMYWLTKICKYLESRNSLGGWLASFWLTMILISHLRGSLYNHTDFYVFPMIIFVYFLLKHFRFD